MTPSINTDSTDADRTRWTDLSEFQQQTIMAIVAHEDEHENPPYGLRIKKDLEAVYESNVNHGRLYPNLDDLVELGLVEKSELDRRTNAYASTVEARTLLCDAAERMADVAGLDVSKPVATDGGRDSDFFDLDGETEIHVECTTPRAEPDLCDGWDETIALDEPAYIDDDERVHFPGFEWQCPDCGNPHNFVVNGVEVSNLV